MIGACFLDVWLVLVLVLVLELVLGGHCRIQSMRPGIYLRIRIDPSSNWFSFWECSRSFCPAHH